MALTSPGLQITVTDESQYVPGAVGTVPLVLLATAQDKIINGAVATGTTAANAGKLQQFNSQRELVSALGYPYFEQSAAGTPIHGGERNEYGLMAAYSAMGLGNRMFAIRADINLDELEQTAVRPKGSPDNGTYWFDLSETTWGINEWNLSTNSFTAKTPIIINSASDVTGSPPAPKTSIGTIGSYAVVTYSVYNYVYYKNVSNDWVLVGSDDWQNSVPAVTGTETDPELDDTGYVINVNTTPVTINGTDLDSIISAINDASITGVTAETNAAIHNGKLVLYITNDSESNGTTADGRAYIVNDNPAEDVMGTVGIAEGYQESPTLFFGSYVEVPSWRSTDLRPRPTNSIYMKTSALGAGASFSFKVYNATTAKWTSVAAPIYPGESFALYGLDPTQGGLGIQAGSIFVLNDYFTDATQNVRTATFRPFVRTKKGVTKVIGLTPAGTFNGAHSFTILSSNVGSNAITTTVVSMSGGTTKEAFVAAILAANIPNVSAAIESNGSVSISHTAGGVIGIANDGGGTAVTNAGFTGSTPGVYVAPNGYIVLSNFAPLDYTPDNSAPYTPPADGTLWYSGDLEADIMVCESDGWKGYRTVTSDARGYDLSLTDATGPIFSASKPATQSSGDPLVSGDLWIDTSDLENYPKMYRYDGTSFVSIDNTDFIDQNGIVFADARWDTDGTTDPINDDLPAITDLLLSDYLDLDAPDYRLYARGTLLFNTRRSTFNIKQYVSGLFTETNYPDDPLPDIPAAWVTASGLKSDASPYMGHKAQRAMVVKSLQAALAANTDVREERFTFSLIIAPGYPELIDDMVALNNDRKNTAFVIGDTPLNLAANGIDIVNWSNGESGAYGNGLTTADPYLGVYYPACITSDVQGNEICMPASHMALRVFIRSDNVSFPWFAPAGTRRGLVDNATSIGFLRTSGATTVFVQNTINQGLRDTMYENAINPITNLPGVGLTVFGQKTRNGTASALDRVNVARLVNYIRTILANSGNAFLFEPNDKQTRDSFQAIISSAFNDIKAKRGIYDYVVVCDTSNNTPDRIARNELYVDIAIEPAKSVEFIYIPIRLKNPGDIAKLGR